MSGIITFDLEDSVSSKINKATAIIEILSMTKHYSNYKRFSSQKDLLKYMLNEMGMTEHTKNYDNRPEKLDFINIDVLSLLKKNEYLFINIFSEDILLIKVFDEYLLRFVCCESEDILLKHNIRLLNDFFYIFTSKSENSSVIYNIRDFVNNRFVPFFDNYYNLQKKELLKLNRKLKSMSKEGRVMIDNFITVKINKNLFSEKEKYLNKLLKKVTYDIKEFYDVDMGVF